VATLAAFDLLKQHKGQLDPLRQVRSGGGAAAAATCSMLVVLQAQSKRNIETFRSSHHLEWVEAGAWLCCCGCCMLFVKRMQQRDMSWLLCEGLHRLLKTFHQPGLIPSTGHGKAVHYRANCNAYAAGCGRACCRSVCTRMALRVWATTPLLGSTRLQCPTHGT
jgi:hypothetical protein